MEPRSRSWVDAEHGEDHYRKALALAETRGMRPLVAHCRLGLGKLFAHTDKREQAQEHLRTATTMMYREINMRFWLEQADAALAELGCCSAPECHTDNRERRRSCSKSAARLSRSSAHRAVATL